MKRVLALILALVMVLTFISCGKKDEPADSDTTVENGTVEDGTTEDTTTDDTTTEEESN